MRRSMLLGVIAAMAASCTVQEADVLMDERTEPVFYATFEQPEEDTKVYANEQLLIRWHEDDRVSIFNKLTYNQQYQFTGKTGDNSGGFRKVDGDEFVTGNTLNDIVAVYPYQQGTSIAEDEVLSVELPADQVYAHNTFGRGANTMVSVSSGNVLMFKNVGAYLMFSLYGEGVSVSSITLRGNNYEKLSGKAYVTMPLNGVPSTQMVGDAADASGAITLRCEEPVTLGASASECTEFWFVVPPVTFSRGFTITITQSNGGTVEKSTSRSVVLTRNKLSKMAPMEVEKAAAPEPEAVDLGLPSGLKWASWNVGASAPEEHGDYFAWGETEPKSDYSESTYKWSNGDKKKLTKYCTKSNYWDGSGPIDYKEVLDPEDDAAHVNWGGSWRMPTFAEWQELVDNCTRTWTTQNGVNGYKVTSMTNGNSVFLPAAGAWINTYLVDVSSGNYWSSSLYTDNSDYAYNVYLNSDDFYWISYCDRCYGLSVRPVYGEFIPVSSISLEPSSLELKVGESYTLSVTISPSNATEKTVHWVSSDGSVATVDETGLLTASGAGTATITAYGSSGVSAECEVTVKEHETETITIDGYECVDLGLPSGLKWATCNVGADKPEEYGDYFAWGETEPYYEAGYAQSESPVWKSGKESGYYWPSYKFELGTDYDVPFSKYVTNSDCGTVDNKTVLDLEDDAAHVNWGGSWRMPTIDECQELRNKCTWTWTSQNGVKGRKGTGPNGKSIFLPSAGYRYHTSLYSAGSYGSYWSSSLSADYPFYAINVYFYSVDYYWSSCDRYYGQSVRPVYGEFIPVSSISVEPSSLELKVGESYTLSATIIPSNATEKTVHWVSSDDSVAVVDANGLVYAAGAGTATITAYGSSGVSALCTVTVDAASLSAPDGVEAVELGLPSGLKWASMNVGASKPEQYGAHFAWGETEPKTNYTWETYKWCNGDYNKLTKYCTQSDYWNGTGLMDNKTELDPEDDAAHVNWGGSWRMPTLSECEELLDNCTWTWTTQNGVNGRKVTGPNGKSIFLPAAGSRYDTNLGGAASYGYYWSSSLNTDYPDSAYYVYFYSVNYYWDSYNRYYGFSVRPVSE